MQKHILAAIVRRDKAEPPRMIEEFDRAGLTHGKLLFPSKWSVQRARKIRQVGNGERNHVASQGAYAARLHPGSQSARKAPYSRGVRLFCARPNYLGAKSGSGVNSRR